MRKSKRGLVQVCLIVPLLAAGCQDSTAPAGKEGAAPSGMRVEGVSTDKLEVPPPNVSIDGDGVMTVQGNVRRRAGVTETISGRVDIDVIGPDGKPLEWIPALLTPDPMPTEGKGESGYIIHYGWIPPSGSTVRVHWVDSKTAAREDADETEYSSGGYGDGRAAHQAASPPSHGRHGGHGHMSW
jgi:hypothetical protein